MSAWDEKAEDAAERAALEASPWAPAEATRFGGFVDGTRWQREALLSEESVERAAHGIHASHDRGWHFDAEDHAVQDEYRDMARVALTAAIGDDDE